MKRSMFYLAYGFVAMAICMFATTTQAQAQATRTWVSGVGDDANPCSRTAPCKTFAGAISKTAAGGEIDALDPGGFGTLTIGKALTIDGGGGQVASVLGGPNAFNINAGANDNIIIRNLRFNGINQVANTTQGAIGINFIAGHSLHVENCYIFGFTNVGINFQPVVRSFLDVTDTVIDNNTNGGLVSATTATTGGVNRANIIRSSFMNNGFGVKSGQNSNVTVRDSLISNNTADSGVLSSGTAAEATIVNSVVANNQFAGLHATNSGTVKMALLNVNYNNGPGWLADAGGVISSWGNNFEAGNAAVSAAPTPLTPR